jgi:D-amino-acid dehydrogenase
MTNQFDQTSETGVIIVGAGIIGICCAAYLAEQGHPVTVIDRTGICEETSSGNAAALAFSDVLPLAHKGMMKNLPRWLADPLGPLDDPARLSAEANALAVALLARRAWRILRGEPCRAGRDDEACRAGMDGPARPVRHAAHAARGRLAGALRKRGRVPRLANRLGARDPLRHRLRHVAGDEMAALQPGLSPQFVKGTFVPGWKTVADPKLLGKAIWAYAESWARGSRSATVAGCAASDGSRRTSLRRSAPPRRGRSW